MVAKSLGIIKETNAEIAQVIKRECEELDLLQQCFRTMITVHNKDNYRPIEMAFFFEELPVHRVGLVGKATISLCLRTDG
jgi:protein SERAC1